MSASVAANLRTSSKAYQQCVCCVMDTTDPDIAFDDEGVCSHCAYFEREVVPAWPRGETASRNLSAMIDGIRSAGRGRQYDCILGMSGGVDSSYLALLASRWGLRPLVVHVDAGWNSELAVRNIELMVTKLNFDLHTVVIDWDEMRDLQLAFLRSNTSNQDIPQDHAFAAATFKLAMKHDIKFIVSGTNYATESILPQSWGYDAMDVTYLKSIHNRHGARQLRSFPLISFPRYYLITRGLLNIQTVCPLNYISYSKEMAIDELEREFGWRYYGGKHYESRWTRFFQAHYLPRKFGFDKRKAHLSSLILSGAITRNQAVQELKKPLYTDNELAEDKAFVAKKLGLTADELQAFIDAPAVADDEYAMHTSQLAALRYAIGAQQLMTRAANLPRRVASRIIRGHAAAK